MPCEGIKVTCVPESVRRARQDVVAFATLIANADVELRIACFHGPYAVVFRYDDRDIDLLARETAVSIVNVVAAWASGYNQLD
jgi:hypothetical protein